MKITTDRVMTEQKVESVSGAGKAAAVERKKGAKAPPKGDRVEISARLDAELKTRQAEQAQRVEAIKAQVRAGKYRIGAQDVAEKMLSRNRQG